MSHADNLSPSHQLRHDNSGNLRPPTAPIVTRRSPTARRHFALPDGTCLKTVPVGGIEMLPRQQFVRLALLYQVLVSGGINDSRTQRPLSSPLVSSPLRPFPDPALPTNATNRIFATNHVVA